MAELHAKEAPDSRALELEHGAPVFDRNGRRRISAQFRGIVSALAPVATQGLEMIRTLQDQASTWHRRAMECTVTH